MGFGLRKTRLGVSANAGPLINRRAIAGVWHEAAFVIAAAAIQVDTP